ncbi:MAG: ROK family protein [Thermomicrobiales bacterium]
MVPARRRGSVTLRRRIIDLLLTRRTLSRAELARLTRLNKPTISAVVARLIDDGIVHEIGAGVSTGGRKPILLAVRETSRLVVGVEIDAAGCRLLLVTLRGESVAAVDLPMATPRVEVVVDTIAAGIDALFADRDRSALLGCGVAAPGLVDPAQDTVDSATRLGWRGVPLRGLLEARLQTPVMVTDRGKAAGLGELWVLGKEQAHDLIYLYLGRGVAGAIVLGHEIHWGSSFMAGEIGHMTVDPRGPACACGSHGCLEALVSTAAILGRGRRLLTTSRDSALRSLLAEGAPDMDGIAAIGGAATGGDPLALEIVRETARWLGLAIANLVNALNPAVVILGGPTAEWGQVLIDAIDRELQAWTLPLSRRAVRVVAGEARERAVPLGAAALVLQRAGELLARPHVSLTTVETAA